MAIASIWEGSPPCSSSAVAKALSGLCAASLDHEEQTRVLGIQYIGHVAVPASGTGLIDGNPPQGAPVALSVCLLHIVHQHSPQTGIVLIEQIGHRIDGHLRAEQHHESFHHQGETAAFSGPGQPAPDGTPSLRQPSTWHSSHQFAAILEKVHMPPAPFDRVVNSTQVFADRTLEMFPGHVLESQFQAFRFTLKAALGLLAIGDPIPVLR